MNPLQLLWISFYKWTYAECLSQLKGNIEAKKTAFVVTPNPEMLYEASSDSELLAILQKADYALPDGAGIFVAYQISASTLPKVLKYIVFPHWCIRTIFHTRKLQAKYGQRITGARLTTDFLSYANEKNIPVTIIDPLVSGETPRDIAKRASQASMKKILQEKYPAIPLVLVISNTVPEVLPENGIVLATHGNGRQEKILSEVLKKYPSCGLAIGVGGSIDLITGFRSPAPWFVGRFGGEWLYRLMKNPRRHLRRIKKVIGFLRICLNK